jgi:hypothetical protein
MSKSVDDNKLMVALTNLLKPRCISHLYQKLDGSYTISTTAMNPNSRFGQKTTVTVRGYDIYRLILEAESELTKRIDNLNLIP